MMAVPHKDKFKPLIKVIKSYTRLLFITVTSIGLSCNHKSTDSDKPAVSSNSISIKCYHFWNTTDSISLTMETKGDSIKGTLVYHLFQKDKNTGVIHGKIDNDLIIANYTFQSEGVQSLRQVVFKRIGDNLIEGNGAIENKNGGIYFRNIDSLKFNNSILLKLTNCRSTR